MLFGKFSCAAMLLSVIFIVGQSAAGAQQEPAAKLPPSTEPSTAQAPAPQPDVSPDTQTMTAAQFETWIKAEDKKLSGPRENLLGTGQRAQAENLAPVALERALLERLRDESYTTDETIVTVVQNRLLYESPRVGDAGIKDAAGKLYPNTKLLIDELMPLLYGRSDLQARLHETKAGLFSDEDDAKGEIAEREQARSLLHQEHLDVDRRRIRNIISLAGEYLQLGNRQKADELYTEVKSYPWYLVRDPEWDQIFRTSYIDAVRGLIDARRGDLKALQAIFIYPAVKEEVGDYLKRAIAGAKNEDPGKQ